MSARVTFLQPAEKAASAEPAVLIPSGALRRDAQGENFVWVVTDGRVRQQRIETAGEVGGKLRVTTGLKGGEAVVVTGDPAREGQRVAVVDG
jgi:multidrug efflux system membrane fusion protein